MRQEHRAGEKLFVDYAGQTLPVYDLHANQIQEAQIFVAALGASNYAYCGSHLEPSASRLDRIPLPRLQLLWRGLADRSPRQPQKWCNQSLLLRTRYQPHISGYGQSL